MAKSKVQGFRLYDRHFAKLDYLASKLGTSRNNVLAQLIDEVELETELVEVSRIKNRNTQTLASERVAVPA